MTNEESRSSTLRTIVLTLIALLAGYGLMQMGNTLQGTLLSVRGGIEGFAAWEIGAIGAGFWLGIVFGSLRAHGQQTCSRPRPPPKSPVGW